VRATTLKLKNVGLEFASALFVLQALLIEMWLTKNHVKPKGQILRKLGYRGDL
jgi:hypothetical protein